MSPQLSVLINFLDTIKIMQVKFLTLVGGERFAQGNARLTLRAGRCMDPEQWSTATLLIPSRAGKQLFNRWPKISSP